MNKFFDRYYPAAECTEEEWNAFLSRISHEMTVGAFESRLGEHYFSGEWIIFAKHEGRNYYLTLASHSEDDDAILQKLACSAEEFPFLENYL